MAAQPRLEESLRRLSHRGPDGAGQFVRDGVALGVRRLAIIDLEHGEQPIFNESRSVAVVCNGELYNYPELLRDLEVRGHRFQSGSDVNVLPHLYEEKGTHAIDVVRGMFAAALWDESMKRLVLWRDRVGKKPLFYATRPDGIAFASELPALIALLDRRPAINFDSLGFYLQMGFVPQPNTIYRGIRVVPPGTCLTWSAEHGLDVARYWTPRRVEGFGGSYSEALELADGALRESVRLRLRSDVPIGLFLSGGIDSGLVASYAVALGAKDLLAFVVEVDDPQLNEGPAAERTARHLGLRVERIPLRVNPSEEVLGAAVRYGQPFADSSAIPSYRVARAAAGHRKVVLNGDGGDEIFAGYRRYRLGSLAARLRPEPGWCARSAGRVGTAVASKVDRRTAAGYTARALRGMGLGEAERYVAWTADLFGPEAIGEWFPDLPIPQWGDDQSVELQCHDTASMMDTDFRLILSDDLLVKMDIATMANSLEARSPLLDVPLIETIGSFPIAMIAAGRRTKPMLRDLAKRYLPSEISAAPKRGFEVPVARWLADELRPLVEESVLAADSRITAFGDKRRLAGLVDGTTPFPGHRANAVWAILMLELFLRATPPSAAAA